MHLLCLVGESNSFIIQSSIVFNIKMIHILYNCTIIMSILSRWNIVAIWGLVSPRAPRQPSFVRVVKSMDCFFPHNQSRHEKMLVLKLNEIWAFHSSYPSVTNIPAHPSITPIQLIYVAWRFCFFLLDTRLGSTTMSIIRSVLMMRI